MAQLKTSHKAGAAVVATILLTVPLTSKWEGVWLTAKPDTLAHGIPTVCFGETEGVKLGDTYTLEECKRMLAAKLPRYLDEIDRCIKVPVSNRTRGAYLDAAYNVGSGGICKSTAMRLLNAGHDKEACNALRPFNHAGGVYRQGLANRREDEITNYCLAGLKEDRFLVVNGDNVGAIIAHAEVHNPKINAEPKPVLPPKKPWYTRFWNWLLK